MTLAEIIALIESGLNLGMDAVEIVTTMCAEFGGATLPTVEDLAKYQADTQAMRDTPHLTPKASTEDGEG